MHALEKLWKAAYVFHAEGSLEAGLWVLPYPPPAFARVADEVVVLCKGEVVEQGRAKNRRVELVRQ